MKKLIVTLSIFILLLTNSILANATDIVSTNLTSGWQYLSEVDHSDQYSNSYYVLTTDKLPWVNFQPPAKPGYKSPEGEIWLRVKLPKPSLKYIHPSIYFMTYDQNFELYFDQTLEPLKRFGGFDEFDKLKSPGSFWHLIDLPEDYEGKYLYLRMYSARAVNHGLIKDFQLCSHTEKLSWLIKSNIWSFIHACLYIFVGLFSICFSFIRKTGKRRFVYLAFSAAATGFWLLAEGGMKPFFAIDARIWVYVDIISQYSIPIFYSLFINEMLQNMHRRILMMIVYVHTAILCGALLVDAFDVMPLVATLNAFYIPFGINMAIMIFVILTSIKKWNTDLRIFMSGFSFLCLTGILDLVHSTDRTHSNIMYTQIGVFVLLSSFAVLLVYNILKAEKNGDMYMDELNSKEEILFEKNRQLDEAMINDKLKNEFFSNISHELKTPLNIILSTIQLLTKYNEAKLITSTEKDLARYLYIMKQNSYRLIRLVNNLIDMTKIDAGYLSTDLKNNDIISVVEDITQSVADYIKRNGISITFDTDVEEKIIACDPDKIERIMLNLLSNAVKFSKPGSSILVDMKDHDDTIEIIVQDTGIGLTPDKLDLIFERFAQVDKSLTRNHEGSGIGLSLVKSLVEMHGGTISVESEYGKGSTFKIILPATIAEFAEKEHVESEIQAVHVEKVNIEFSDIYS